MFFISLVIQCLSLFLFLVENMIRGLDGDETVFLDMVARQQEEIANRRFDEESQEIREYRVYCIVNFFVHVCDLRLMLKTEKKIHS